MKFRERVEPKVGDDGVPRCTEDCRSHDGKRCGILGYRPGPICEPAVADMARALGAAKEAK